MNQMQLEQKDFLKMQTQFMQHLALMVDRMTRLITKYEMVLENYSNVTATLVRIESKVDSLPPDEAKV